MSNKAGFRASLLRETRVLTSRTSYLMMMIIVPVLMVLFFTQLLAPGLPLKVPAAIVDLDGTKMSRSITRNLDATELISIDKRLNSYDEAMTAVRRGEVFGFFIIPRNFEKDAIAGNRPTLEFYNNLTYFVPGTLAFKGFKTVAVTTAGGIVQTKLISAGLTDEAAASMVQPVSLDDHPIGNPWMSYSIYLCPSFVFGTLALLIMMMTVFGITMEIKRGTSVEWVGTAGGNMWVALAGKLLPQFLIWSVVGLFSLAYLFGIKSYPCNHPGTMILGMELFIIASQAMGVLFAGIVPNVRLSLIMACLTGILTFSFAGYSFPVQNMYGAIAIFSYLVPVRYLFLTYIFSGLNDFPIYYSRLYLAALLVFPLVASLLVGRLRKACLNPVYVP